MANIRWLLWPLGLIFWSLAALRSWLYQWGVFRTYKLSKPVLSVGNLSTGGTGKTPWVELLTQTLQSQSKKVVLLSRGYSGDFDGVLKVTDDMDPRKCGDEPLWLHKKTGVPVYVGRKRWEAGSKALQQENPDLFILDDAFQHQKLVRDMNLVLLDASVPRWHYQPLPVGYLREGFGALKRADWVILNKCNFASKEDLLWLKSKVEKIISSKRLLLSDFCFAQWKPLVTELAEEEPPKESLAVSCGIGNPHAFKKTLELLKMKINMEFIFPDHYFWKPDDIERMTFRMKQERCRHLMITEKDAIKLARYRKHFFEMGIQVWVCEMKVKIHDKETEFWQHLSEVLQ
jgi:tetraacyldisaccharide 4'-kinase